MNRIISILNHKGGVLKTTSAFHLGGYLAVRDRAAVLLVDCDPQGTLTKFCGYDPEATEPSLADVLLGAATLKGVMKRTAILGMFLIPASKRLREAEHTLRDRHGGAEALRNVLRPVAPGFAYTLIDGPPALDLLNMNALIAGEHILIPCGSSKTDIDQLVPFFDTIDQAREKNPELYTAGVFLTKHQQRTTHSQGVLKALHSVYPAEALETCIPVSTDSKDSTAARQPLEIYNPKSKCAIAYAALAEEVKLRIAHVSVQQPKEAHHHAQA